MTCKCGSNRIASVNSKASDLHFVSIGENEQDGYLPSDMGIGGGDYVEFSWCLNCGQIQDDFPLKPCALEMGENEDGECRKCGELTEDCECKTKCKECGEWTSKADLLDCVCETGSN
jgi:hypothetical protein